MNESTPTYELLKKLFILKTVSFPLVSQVTPIALQAMNNLGLRFLSDAILRRTFFQHFCAGENEDDVIKSITRLKEQGMSVILDFATENDRIEAVNIEEQLKNDRVQNEEVLDKLKVAILIASRSDSNFVTLKLTSIISPLTLSIKARQIDVPPIVQQEFQRDTKRLSKLCEFALENKTRLMIDAEQSWYQKSINEVALSLQKKYNKTECMIYNTYQMYLKRGFDDMKRDYELSKRENFVFGVKLVRGAYIESETVYANQKNLESPICRSYEETNVNFENAIDYLLSNKVHTVFATHNINSITYVKSRIEPSNNLFSFAQLYGMSDSVSSSLTKEGFKVYKYVPYGPLEKVIPYLLRRTQENSSIFNHTQADVDSIWKELRKRFF